MSARLVRPTHIQSGTLCAMALLFLSSASCFRTVEVSKLHCLDSNGCPSGNYCTNGRCVAGQAPADGSNADLPLPSGVDGRAGLDATQSDRGTGGNVVDGAHGGAGGGSMDGLGDGGTSGDTGGTGPRDGSGGAGGGSGGGLSNGGTSGGTGGTGPRDAPGSTGGTTFVPDAHIASDVADGPGDLANGLSPGSTCSSTTPGQCSSGFCVDGRCCRVSSCGTCQSCIGPGGTCAAITNAEDSDSCTGANICDASGACKRKAGQTCTAGTQCMGGNCADGVCCNTPCDGSCEYCNGSSPGTCGFITGTPKTGHPACAGTGPCQGTCNGTKAACTLPGAEMTCRQASCSGSTATNLAVCDGLGNCPAASTTSCSPFVCGATSCLTTCSASSQCVSGAACIGGACQTCAVGQSVCGNACVNLQTDPDHCGNCTTSCSSGLCLNGGCVQCTQVSHCPAGYQACDPTTHTCVCRQKSSSNLLTNPGFDGSATGWTMVGGAAYQATADADGCPDSGAVWLNSVGHEVKQCRPASPNTLYSMGLKFKGTGPGDTPGALCMMQFYAGADCTTPSATSNSTFITPGGTTTSWVQGAASATSPPDAGSVLLICVGQYGFGYHDQFYFSSTNATF